MNDVITKCFQLFLGYITARLKLYRLNSVIRLIYCGANIRVVLKGFGAGIS